MSDRSQVDVSEASFVRSYAFRGQCLMNGRELKETAYLNETAPRVEDPIGKEAKRSKSLEALATTRE